MSWVKLDDQFPNHPKVVGLRAESVRTHIAALCYCARYLTDGELTKAAVLALRGEADVADLVASGLWEESGSGYRVHDYLTYNPTREQELARREKDAARKQRGRKDSKRTPRRIRPDSSGPVPVPVLRESQQPSAAAPQPGFHAESARIPRDTWLTPYGEPWQVHIGEPPWGEMAKFLAPIQLKYGPLDTLVAWKRYCAEIDPQYASPAHFCKTTVKWGLGNGAKPRRPDSQTADEADRKAGILPP